MRSLRYLLVLALFSAALAAQTPSAPPGAANRILFVVEKEKELEANHYLWAAEMAASRMTGDNKVVVEGGLTAALKEARANPSSVRGIVEIVLNVYSWEEDVRISCYDPSGRPLWKKKSSFNMGGNEEELARKLFERALEKAEKMPPCGGK